jgi:hypothetical protein
MLRDADYPVLLSKPLPGNARRAALVPSLSIGGLYETLTLTSSATDSHARRSLQHQPVVPRMEVVHRLHGDHHQRLAA